MSNSLHKRREKRKINLFFLILSVMLTSFCVLKVLRGSYTESTVEGGIWNYISLLYYPMFFVAFIFKAKYLARPIFGSVLWYVFFAVFSALLHFDLQLNILSLYQLLMIPYSVLVFLTFYLCADDCELAEKTIVVGYIACLGINLYSILTFRFVGEPQAMESDIYFSLGLFPFALQILKSKPLKAVFFVLEFFAVFMVNKRAAFTSFIIALVVYMLVNAWVKDNRHFGSLLKATVIAGVFLIVFYIVSKQIDDNYRFGIYLRLFSLAEDGGSGRDVLYERIWEAFQESSFAEKLLGHGMNTAGRVGGAGQAHNDFLEILYDYGVFAALSASVFYLLLIKEGLRLIKRRSPYAASFAFSLVIGIFLALFSYFLIYYTYVTCLMAFWGYTLAVERKRLARDRGRLK